MDGAGCRASSAPPGVCSGNESDRIRLLLADSMIPSDWIAISGVTATVVTAGLGLWFSSSAQRRQQARDDEQRDKQQRREDELRDKQQKREDAQRLIHREDAPHIELSIDCRVLGQDDDDYIVEFTLTANNRGLVRWKFRSIKLRVRGIEKNQPLAYWPGNGNRLQFPIKILGMEEVIPQSVNFLFVEPGVRQAVTYVTKIPSRVIYIVVYVEFWYDKVTPHTSERAFRLSAPTGSTQ